MQVRERIRINGQPISKDLFNKYFWLVYNRLEETKVGPSRVFRGAPSLGCPAARVMFSPSSCSAWQDPAHASMPAYFRFLTIMAFHVFLQEKVSGGGLQLVTERSGWWRPQERGLGPEFVWIRLSWL